MNDTAQKIETNLFLELSISEILRKVKNKEINPVEIAEKCIERIEEYNERFKVWVCYSREVLIEQSVKIAERIK
jgi:Asp-tRNA(Asn)/Glu-tRNA(Gln) amidotransferase A subunit family amidase